MALGDRRLQAVRAAAAADAVGAGERGAAAGDLRAVPADRSCSSRGIGVPSRAVRAANREAVNSMSATSDCASGSRGMSPATMRASRRASAETSGRTHASPAAGR